MKPSFNQNQNASRKLIASGLDSSSSITGANTLLIGLLLFHEPGEQAVENSARSSQQIIVVGNGFAQPCQHPLNASSLHRLNTADIEVMHQGSNAPQTWLDLKTGLKGFEGDAVTDMAEGGVIEVKTQRIYRTVLWVFNQRI
jgi:hypothetical protein